MYLGSIRSFLLCFSSRIIAEDERRQITRGVPECLQGKNSSMECPVWPLAAFGDDKGEPRMSWPWVGPFAQKVEDFPLKCLKLDWLAIVVATCRDLTSDYITLKSLRINWTSEGSMISFILTIADYVLYGIGYFHYCRTLYLRANNFSGWTEYAIWLWFYQSDDFKVHIVNYIVM